MGRQPRMLLGWLSSLALAAACSGVDPNAKIHSPPLPDEGGTAADAGDAGRTMTNGSSSSGGRICPSCEVDDDCVTTCGPTPTAGYTWCCAPGGCYQWSSKTCPDVTAPPPDAGQGGG